MNLLVLLVLSFYIKRSYGVRGISEGKTSGERSTIEEHPAAAHLQIMFSDYNRHCDGTILSDYFVLTAAVCLLDKFKSIRIFVMSTNIADPVAYYSSFSKPILHPDYDNKTEYNIGLVKTDIRMTLGATARPAQLAIAGKRVPEGETLTVVGWGKKSEDSKTVDPYLRTMRVQVMNFGQCLATYKTQNIILRRSFCASYMSADRGSACAGYTGAAAINSNHLQVGIVSSGLGCATGNLPPIFTDVSSLREWIKSVAKV